MLILQKTFVLKYDYGDKSFDKISISELIKIIKGLRVDSAHGKDGIHNRYLKNLSFKSLELVLKISYNLRKITLVN